MKKESPSGIIIFIAIIAVIALLTHCESLNSVPGVYVEPSEVSVDIGDFHYQS